MLIQKETLSGQVSIKNYQPGCLIISGAEYRKAVVLTPQTISYFDGACAFNIMQITDYQLLTSDKPEIIIIGTGVTHDFILPEALAQLNKQGIAIESMATRQACHTFQVLSYEKRRVVALLFP